MLPRGEGHVPPSQRSEQGQRQHRLNILVYTQRGKTKEELDLLLQSLDTNDTFKGYQGPSPKPPVAEPPPETADMGTGDTPGETLEVGTDAVPVHTVSTETAPVAMVSVGTLTDPLPPPPTPQTPAAASASASEASPAAVTPTPKPLPKPALPKVPRALNEASQLVDPANLVEWARISVLPVKLQSALADLGKQPHIMARIPRFQEMYSTVQARLNDPHIQQVAADCGLTWQETEALVACPDDESQR
jgi:hypothetical protein